MRKTILVASVMVLALLMLPTPTASATTPAIPFRATFWGGTASIEWANGVGFDPSATSTFDGRCSTPASWVITNSGAGRATYLGSFTWTSEHCTHAGATPADPITISDGVMEYDVANGDVLVEHYGNGVVSSFTPTWMCIDTAATFVGGTGRFTSASGTVLEHGCFDPQQPLTTTQIRVTSVGTISFDPSDASS